MNFTICLMGPTASGKTDLALKLADHYPVALISVDSALIYQGMDIGSAKPEPEILEKYPHDLINICSPNESYSAGTFYDTANQLMIQYQHAQKIPLFVGGTMMYFNTLFKGLANLPQANPEIREKLNSLIALHGPNYLHRQLHKIDPLASRQIHPNDPQRIARALEVFESSGKPLSAFWQEQLQKTSQHFLKIALNPQERKHLHQRIEKRFDLMLEQGFLDEVKALMARGDLSLSHASMRCVGYRQAWEHLQGQYDFDTMREKAITASRQLAKRQITWLRSFDDVHWFDSLDENLFSKVCELINKTMITSQ